MTEQMELALEWPVEVSEPPVPRWLSDWVLSTSCPDCSRSPGDPFWSHNGREWVIRWTHEATCTASLAPYVIGPPRPLSTRMGGAA